MADPSFVTPCHALLRTRPAVDDPPCLPQLLIESGLIEAESLDEAIRIAANSSQRLLDVLLSHDIVDERVVAAMLSYELSMPWVDPALIHHDRCAAHALPRWVAESLHVLPIRYQQRGEGIFLLVATDDPTDHEAMVACSVWAGMPIRPLVACTSAIHKAMGRWFDEVQVGEIIDENEDALPQTVAVA
ncbi:MAG TPA: hypothetical protein PLJ27_09335 [Polyangiaceae bacterium]|nr:MAG: bacteriophage N4 adsorption protein B [Deltaproteobacteria bacterium ADurb.Bin207]HNS99042.1 hypothetical protein [Polyangiaceae bacterium]HNZ23833.1 hypothetical protein [Polyangiaceae bacterium]HOD22374.1 hypothetical protein [Polyangiaceae bacterium]HOE50559.1 hypothetical protein [Polyangiaceae bacterium]